MSGHPLIDLVRPDMGEEAFEQLAAEWRELEERVAPLEDAFTQLDAEVAS